MSDGPTPEQAATALAADNPVLSLMSMMPDDQLEAMAEVVANELVRRGLRSGDH